MLRHSAFGVKTFVQSFVRSMASTYTVQHNPSDQCFFIPLENGENAVVEYKWTEKSVIDLYHTEVPPSHRGKGIAQLLAKAALDFVVSKDAKVILSCLYMEKFVKDNPLPQYTLRVCKQ